MTMDTLCGIHGVALTPVIDPGAAVPIIACPLCWPVVYTSDPLARLSKGSAGQEENE